ncbi:Hypothetical protein, putative [Bodo saltans]|uniref:Stealth protein CR2 conserved region 2 domain-containing protein n=1 Tax=Bodo saltans TaxID=75058 RepID=A0A0S4JIS6_BODSA|nr:Hypothetical protein, putative [Bodo saltans]|eukprot:CUG89317.1 Hypothetical protein, putative [Bodo saltans]
MEISAREALAELHRAVQRTCQRSFRWAASTQYEHLSFVDNMKLSLLRRLIALLRRMAHHNTITSSGPPHWCGSQHHHHATAKVILASISHPSALDDIEEFTMIVRNALVDVLQSDKEISEVVINLSQDHATLEELVRGARVVNPNSPAVTSAHHHYHVAHFEFDLHDDDEGEHQLDPSAEATVLPCSRDGPPPAPAGAGAASFTVRSVLTTTSPSSSHTSGISVSHTIVLLPPESNYPQQQQQRQKTPTPPMGHHNEHHLHHQHSPYYQQRQSHRPVAAAGGIHNKFAVGFHEKAGNGSILERSFSPTALYSSWRSSLHVSPASTATDGVTPNNRFSRQVLLVLLFLFALASLFSSLRSIHHGGSGELMVRTKLMAVAPTRATMSGAINETIVSDGTTKQWHCPSDRTTNPSGLPGSSDYPVDSIVALSFDLTDTELSMIDRLETAQLATRSTFVRDVIARAMSADARDEASAYHSFFADRNARMETVDVTEESRSRFYGAMKGVTGNMDGKNASDGGFRCPPMERVLVDAVYTYVNPASASHRTATAAACKQGHKDGCSGKRFRDFNELLHSLRTVHYRGQHGEGHALRDGPGRVVGDVYVVVANRDQMPTYLRHTPVRIARNDKYGVRDGSEIFSVTHDEIFPQKQKDQALPSFNSFAIEANLHRIPGLRRFFVYFNNDMFWGRKVSFFDYFRPLSHVRQEFHARTTPEGRCLAQQVGDHVAGDKEFKKRDATPNRRRAVVFMETVHYFETENVESNRKLTATGYHSNRAPRFPLPVGSQQLSLPTLRGQQRLLRSRENDPLLDAPSCLVHPLKSSSFFKLRMPDHDEPLRKTDNYNRNLVFEQYGLPPSHTFAHYPGIYDRAVLSRMLDDELREIAETTTASRFRVVRNLWVTMVYPWIAFAHRRAVDRSLAIDELRLWKEPLPTSAPSSTCRFSRSMLSDMTASSSSSSSGFAMRQRSSSVGTFICCSKRIPTYRLPIIINDVRSIGPLMDPTFGELPEVYQGNMWLSMEAATVVAAILSSNESHNMFSENILRKQISTSSSVVANAKLHHLAVSLDDGGRGGGSDMMYKFCMMSFTSLPGCYLDLWMGGLKLFITANDDLVVFDPLSVAAVNGLISLVSKGLDAAPWEEQL